MQVKWLKRALKNLDAEAAYIAQENPKAANECVSHIIKSIQQLANHPQYWSCRTSIWHKRISNYTLPLHRALLAIATTIKALIIHLIKFKSALIGASAICKSFFGLTAIIAFILFIARIMLAGVQNIKNFYAIYGYTVHHNVIGMNYNFSGI